MRDLLDRNLVIFSEGVERTRTGHVFVYVPTDRLPYREQGRNGTVRSTFAQLMNRTHAHALVSHHPSDLTRDYRSPGPRPSSSNAVSRGLEDGGVDLKF